MEKRRNGGVKSEEVKANGCATTLVPSLQPQIFYLCLYHDHLPRIALEAKAIFNRISASFADATSHTSINLIIGLVLSIRFKLTPKNGSYLVYLSHYLGKE